MAPVCGTARQLAVQVGRGHGDGAVAEEDPRPREIGGPALGVEKLVGRDGRPVGECGEEVQERQVLRRGPGPEAGGRVRMGEAAANRVLDHVEVLH